MPSTGPGNVQLVEAMRRLFLSNASVHVADDDYSRTQLSLLEKRKLRWLILWFVIGSVITGIISSVVYANSCGLENDLPCPHFYPQEAVVGDAAYAKFTDNVVVNFHWDGYAVRENNGTDWSYVGGEHCKISMDTREENVVSYWEDRLGENITIVVHKKVKDFCMTLQMGAIRAFTSQFFGWVCILCILCSLYNAYRFSQVKVRTIGGMVHVDNSVTEVHAIENDHANIMTASPVVVATGDSTGGGADHGSAVRGRVVESTDHAEIALPVASSIQVGKHI